MSWSNNGATFDDTWEYDGQNWTRVRPTTSPSTRAGVGIAFDSLRRRTIVAGGTHGVSSYPTGDTWEYGSPQTLSAHPPTVSIATGGTQTLTLHSARGHGGKLYWIFGSMTGTMPGVSLFGVPIPLNPDAYTVIAIGAVNSKAFTNFRGTFRATGNATALLNIPAKLPIPIGFKLYHGYVLYDGTTGQVYASSNPVSVEFK
jgi:hypothetical protein